VHELILELFDLSFELCDAMLQPLLALRRPLPLNLRFARRQRPGRQAQHQQPFGDTTPPP